MSTWEPLELATPDMDRLAEVFDLDDTDDTELLAELLDAVLVDGQALLVKLFEAGRDPSTPEAMNSIKEISHQLKSTLGNVGYSQASQLCARIMEESGRGDAEACTVLVGEFEQGFDQLIQGIRDFKDQL